MFNTDNTAKRLERVRAMEARDTNKFRPNPLGAGFLTRRERYSEVIWELQRRLRNAEQVHGCVWRDAETPFAANH
jgi:hypothetical protein